MKSLWNKTDAEHQQDDLALRVYSSRLLGQDPHLVLHGGGNTSVKLTQPNLFGEAEEILYVKGSGWDLASIESAGFAPVRMQHLLALAELDSMTDAHMVNELKTHMTIASAPTPSVETILHALLPYKYVDHTHADAIVTITNTANGRARIEGIYGDEVVIIPYVMPGFDLARQCATIFKAEATDKTIGMVLLNHGIFSFGDSAEIAYERMISLVDRAEQYLQAQQAWVLDVPMTLVDPIEPLKLATLRREISGLAGQPMIVSTRTTPECLDFANRSDIGFASQQGPATPDHVIRTKQFPLIGLNVAAFAQEYTAYFNAHASAPRDGQSKTMLDPAPRVILHPVFGMATVGQTAKDADIVADIYTHTLEIIQRAILLGGYQALPTQAIFDVEYWTLEQAKLQQAGRPKTFAGEVVFISGAASGIGKACAQTFLQQGAAVVGFDLNAEITTQHACPAFLGIQGDVTKTEDIDRAIADTVYRFGGIDMLILNAGVFPSSCRIDRLEMSAWRRVLNINLDATFALMQAAHPYLAQAPQHGRVVVIGSKNVPAPGPGAAAYSASKAAVNQLARVAALEWGQDHIRINTLHPNAVFDTGLWTEAVLSNRAQHYGLDAETYKKNNVLKTEVTSQDVGALAAAMCGPLFAKTTGAQLPIDGGNDRVI